MPPSTFRTPPISLTSPGLRIGRGPFGAVSSGDRHVAFGLRGQIGALRHGEHSGDRVDGSGDDDDPVRQRRADHPDDQRHVLDHAVLDTEHQLAD